MLQEQEMSSLILMNKEHSVCQFQYDFVTHTIFKIEKVFDIEYAPLGIIDFQSKKISRKLLNDWWKGRCIPDGRSNIEKVLKYLNIDSQMELLELSHGLSLSDQYWVHAENEIVHWKDINFFDNDFSEELGDVLIGGIRNMDGSSFSSPDNSTDGMLEKRWKIENGKRLLYKGGRNPNKNEPFNEVIASMLYKRILKDNEYVEYSLKEVNGNFFSVCECLINSDEEMIPAQYIDKLKKFKGSDSSYEHYISICEELGLVDARNSINKMIVCDFILHNHDRHYRNFGVIRNVDTLEFTRIIPLFDNGNSLWHDSDLFNIGTVRDHDCHPFKKKYDEQLHLVKNLDWFEPKALDGFSDEMREILSINPSMNQDKINRIISSVQNNINIVCTYKKELSIKENIKGEHSIKSFSEYKHNAIRKGMLDKNKEKAIEEKEHDDDLER